MIGVEVAIIKTAIWLMNFETIPILDLVAYAGYKFVNAIVNITAGLLAGSTGFWFSYVANCLLLSVFLVRSVKESLNLPSGANNPKRIRNQLLLTWAVFQIVLLYFLCSLDFQHSLSNTNWYELVFGSSSASVVSEPTSHETAP